MCNVREIEGLGNDLSQQVHFTSEEMGAQRGFKN